MEDDGFHEYNQPPRKQKFRSDVWKDLTLNEDDDVDRTITCKYCRRKLSAVRGSGTSHLLRHVAKCRATYGDVVRDSNAEFKFSMSELRKDILFYIVEGGHSFASVEQKGFRRMMTTCNPKFVPFSRATVQRDLMSYYALERDNMKDMLQRASRICLTTDMWKSSQKNQHYICITADFVDDNWKLHKRIRWFRALDPPFDGLSIANEIGVFLTQWNLDDKILTITTNNASYNDVMMTNLKRRLLPKGGLYNGGYFFQVRCCAQIVNLVVQSGLKYNDDTLEKIRTLIKKITKSARRVKDFYETVDKVYHLDVKRKLCLDVQIRWNSTYKMLDSLIYFKDVLVDMRSNESLRAYIPTEDEWDKLCVIHSFLGIFYEVTCLFSSVKSPTSNMFFKGAWMIHRQMMEALDSPYDYLVNMVCPMVEKFKKYWSDYNLYLSCVAILDPRFKVKFVEYCFTKLFGKEEAIQRVNAMLRILKSLFNEFKSQAGSSPVVVSTSPPTIGLGSSNFFNDHNTFNVRSSTTQVRRSQLDSYLDEQPYELNEDLDVMDFWSKSSVRYPDLSRMARDMLTIPVSTIASESAFSVSGKTISPNRSSLMPKTVQALICIQDWRRGECDTPIDFELDPDDEDVNVEEVDDEDDIFN